MFYYEIENQCSSQGSRQHNCTSSALLLSSKSNTQQSFPALQQTTWSNLPYLSNLTSSESTRPLFQSSSPQLITLSEPQTLADIPWETMARQPGKQEDSLWIFISPSSSPNPITQSPLSSIAYHLMLPHLPTSLYPVDHTDPSPKFYLSHSMIYSRPQSSRHSLQSRRSLHP